MDGRQTDRQTDRQTWLVSSSLELVDSTGAYFFGRLKETDRQSNTEKEAGR